MTTKQLPFLIYFLLTGFLFQLACPIQAQHPGTGVPASLQPGLQNTLRTERKPPSRLQSDPLPPLDQSCFSSFLRHYTGSVSFIPYDMVRLKDGYMIAGYSHNRAEARTEAVISRLRADGSVLWTQSLNHHGQFSDFTHIRLAPNGNILLAGRESHTVGNSGYMGCNLVMIDPSGNVLWSKYMKGEVHDLKVLADGTFAGTLMTQFGFPPINMFLFRIDANGTILWQKQMNQGYDNHPLYRTILVDGMDIYAAGDFYQQNPNTVQVDRLDKDGNRVWSKRFRVNGQSTWINSLHMIGDSLYVMVDIRILIDIIHHRVNLGVIGIPKDGGALSGYYFDQPDQVDDYWGYYYHYTHRFTTVAKTADNQFVLANQALIGWDSSLVLTKFSPAGKVAWSWRYEYLKKHKVSAVYEDNGNILVLGRKRSENLTPDGIPLIEPFLMRTQPNGLVTPNPAGDCRAVPQAAIKMTAQIEDHWLFTNTTTAGDLAPVPFVPATANLSLLSQMSCGVPAGPVACSSLQVAGQDQICRLTDTVTYTVSRDPGCNVPVQWTYDPARVLPIRVTDTTLAVRFLGPGSTPVIGSIISGCSIISDTLEVRVFSPASLKLGADTVLCAGNSLVLQAGPGLSAYKWQDGSTQASFTVTRPGTYHVEARDACSGLYRDTIIVQAQPPISFNAGPDRTLCLNDTVHLQAPPGFLNYAWSPALNLHPVSPAEVVVSPDRDTAYFVRAEKTPGCFAYDTVRVKVFPVPAIRLGNDTRFCTGDSLLLQAGGNFRSYLWSTGSGADRITVYTAGTYRVQAITTDGCVSADTLEVLPLWTRPAVQLDRNPDLCEGAARTLDAGNFARYLWQDGSTARTFRVQAPGTYHVEVTDGNGCTAGDTARITRLLPQPRNFLPADTLMCAYGELPLRSRQNFPSYLWSTGSTAPGITVDKPGIYWLQVRNGSHCVGRDSIVVQTKECMTGVYVPTAFTPNRDGKNDRFGAQVYSPLSFFELAVFNRWGQVVFRTNDPKQGWDGSLNGADQDPGVFVWVCRYRLGNEAEKSAKGSVMLVR